MRTKLTASHPRPTTTERAPLRPGAPRRPRTATPAGDTPAAKGAPRTGRASAESAGPRGGSAPAAAKRAAPRPSTDRGERSGRGDSGATAARKPFARAGASAGAPPGRSAPRAGAPSERGAPRAPRAASDRDAPYGRTGAAKPASDRPAFKRPTTDRRASADSADSPARSRTPYAGKGTGKAEGTSAGPRAARGDERPRAPYTPRNTERPKPGEKRTDAAEGERPKTVYTGPARGRNVGSAGVAGNTAKTPASSYGRPASTAKPSANARPTTATKSYAKPSDKPFAKPSADVEAVAAMPPREDDGTLRLSKRMSELGLCSRREADEWIEKGWVRVDGAKIDTLGTRVRPEQKIEVIRQAREQQNRLVTILLHKPVGHVSGQPEDGHPPAAALILPDNRWILDASRHRFEHVHLRALAPAGRLDIDSTGLLVFTQDGRVAKQLIGESSEVEKEYLVRVNFDRHTEDVQSHFPAASLEKLRHGLSLDDVPLRPAQVDWQNGEQLRFILREGKKRQIRRMCELVGLEVVGLKRVRIGEVMLGSLPVGEWRYLADNEVF